MKIRMLVLATAMLFGTVVSAWSEDTMGTGNQATYDMLSTVEKKSPLLTSITLMVGPQETVEGRDLQWWQLSAEKESGERFAIRVLSETAPMLSKEAPGRVKRYILREGDAQPVEYIDARTGDALLPKFEFAAELIPQPSLHSRIEGGFAATGTCLGHVLSLDETIAGEWREWPSPKAIHLNPDEIHYMQRISRDAEGKYISEGDYTYVPLTREEVDEMVSLGLNSLMVSDNTEDWVSRSPVFYYKRFREGSKLNYPEILYRSNYQGAVVFIDEPEIHILKDKADLERIRRPEEGAFLITKRMEEIWNQRTPNERRRSLLRQQLQACGANLGTMTLDDTGHPIWVTMLETSFYQLQGGATGVVHEGRYQLADFKRDAAKYLGKEPDITTREMLLLHYAWLRGAARAFGKSWGTSIYGQCDPEIAPEAVTLAYDMGARYVWFWTSDHQHHLPHFMKLKLLRHLQEHKASHPRASLDRLLNAADTAIVLPYGYGYFLNFDQMWESPHLNINTPNSAGVPHRKVMGAALAQGIVCAKKGEDFDFVIDIGQDLSGYSRIVRIGLDGKSEMADG